MFKSGSQILPISLGCDVKSRSGMGIFLQMYSQITSMLYFNCAEIGITGAFSAIVPGEKSYFQILFGIFTLPWIALSVLNCSS